MLSRRQRTWDGAIAVLGIDPAELEIGADSLASLDAWRRIARHLENEGRVSEAAEAWDWAVSEALRADSLGAGDGERALWEASEFFERHDAMANLRATLEQAWAALRTGVPVPAEFAARVLAKLARVYEGMRLPERAAEAEARAAIMGALIGPATNPGSDVRRCA